MRLICPNCDAQYEVDDGAIPHGGRDVQCSNCGHAWFQMHAGALDEAADDLAAMTAAAQAVPDTAPSRPVQAKVPPPKPVADVPPPAPAPLPDAVVAVDPPVPEAPALQPAEPPPAVAQAAPARRTLDENLLAVLREEAAREAAERRAEAGRTIETQPDLGLLEESSRRPQPIEDQSAEEPEQPVTQRPSTRRDLLPDIEEINSTLRPGSEARDEAEAALALPPAKKRASFQMGFTSVLLIAAVLVMVYVMAPQLAARFPATAATLTTYVTTVDTMRVWLDTLMQSAAGGLRSLTGEG